MNPGHISLISSCSRQLIDAKLSEVHRGSISAGAAAASLCPSCGHKIDACKPDWVGLPAGVKFDPTDQELIEHLEAKVKEEDGSRSSHPLINEFIPTIDGDDGICYTHPEKLPGVTRDGLSKHFFHRPSKAYTTGTRKRRKIQLTECKLDGSGNGGGETRWHKTGKTRPVMVGGRQKGCKKILVLYTNFGKNRKPEKTNWVMHQYHLGVLEEEKDGELVVSKIFYQTQPRQCGWSGNADKLQAAMGQAGGSAAGGCSSSARDQHQHQQQFGAIGFPGDAGGGGGGAKSDHFRFSPFRKSFEEVGLTEASSEGREQHEEHDQHHHGIRASTTTSTSAFLHSRVSSISTVHLPAIPPTTAVLDDGLYSAPGILFHPSKFPTGQQHQQRQKHFDHISTSGLEEVLLSCTNNKVATNIQGSSSPAIQQHSQDIDWHQYSYWPPPDTQDHHGS